MWLFALFVAVPMIEIALFIKVGGLIGFWPTMAMVLLSAVLGSALMRSQGRQVLEELRGTMDRMRNPLSPLAHGALIMLGGVLLLTPGFFTDAMGLLLLLPPVRRMVIAYLGNRVQVQSNFTHEADYSQERRRRPDVIDGEFIALDREGPQKPGNSGWTRH